MTKRHLGYFILALFLLNACSTSKEGQVDQTYTLDTVEVTAKHKLYQPEATRTHDIIHTKLDVSFDWENQYLFGKANLTLKPYFYTTAS